MQARTHAHMQASKHARTHASKQARTHARTHPHARAHAHTHTHTHLSSSNSSIRPSYRGKVTQHICNIHIFDTLFLLLLCMLHAYSVHISNLFVDMIMKCDQVCMKCDQACKNQPCKHKKLPLLCVCSIIINLLCIPTTKSFPLLQNLMGFLLQFTEMEYYTRNVTEDIAKIELGVICAHMVDFCKPSHKHI